MTDEVLVRRRDAIVEIRLNRPAKKNALTQAMYGVMADALDSAERDADVRAIIVTAEGDMFCAGNDLSDFEALSRGEASAEDSDIARFLECLARLEKPLIAAVRGTGVGVGATMLLHCDVVVIADEAQLVMPFTSLGLVPEAASSLLLPAQVGYKQAYRMLALGQPVSGSEAVALGLATEAAPHDAVEARAQSWAEEIASRPAEAMQLTKRLLRNKAQIEARLAEELTLFEDRLKSKEARAAFAAFLKKS